MVSSQIWGSLDYSLMFFLLRFLYLMYSRKYIKFLLKYFANNSRYINNFFYTLKLYFEKNINQVPILSRLGLTYRGSKWTNIKFRNINWVFFISYKNLILFLVFIMLIFLFFDFSIISLIYGKISKLVLYIIDLFYYS